MKKIILIICISIVVSCKEKLDLKPNSAIIVPTTASDLELLLDNTDVINYTPAFPQLSADEYFIPDYSTWQAIYYNTEKNASIWQEKIYAGETNIEEWQWPYRSIFYCNNVLDILNKVDISTDNRKKIIKGRALFARAYAFYNLASVFCKGYNANTASTDLGLPLKLTAGIDEILQRSTIQQTYDQIVKDALESSFLLQDHIEVGKRTRPSKTAAFALLSRVYLSMRKYEEAGLYAGKSLELHAKLTDFNTLDPSSNPFNFDSEEIIYFTQQNPKYYGLTFAELTSSYGIEPNLLNLYATSDLRRSLYFQQNVLGNYNMKPVNNISGLPFTGLATDEIYLIKAESLARNGDISQSMELLNKLLRTRWNPNATSPAMPYQNISASNIEDALEKILIERRRALIWRGIRWTDLKRLNLENRGITITRQLGDKSYSLDPNSTRYTLPIPDDEIELSGIQQNIR